MQLNADLRILDSALRLIDLCPDQRPEKLRNPLYFTDDRHLCGAFPADALAERLQELPCLRTVTLLQTNTANHGLPWSSLLAILSLPRLLEFKITSSHFCPIMRPSEQLNVASLAHLTSFQYCIGYPSHSKASPSEVSALAAVLGELCATLEYLDLAPEPVLPSTLAKLHWPRLRALFFYGRAWPSATMPPITLSPVMPGLRDLTINLSDSTPCTMMCPPGRDYIYAWDNLESLCISSPDPEDAIYDHLPSTIRTLSLNYWPHFYVQKHYWLLGFIDNVPSYNAALGSTSMLSILRRCHIPELNCLELEYRADDDDDDLWRYIASAFPQLTHLRIFRLRSVREQEERRDVSVVSPF